MSSDHRRRLLVTFGNAPCTCPAPVRESASQLRGGASHVAGTVRAVVAGRIEAGAGRAVGAGAPYGARVPGGRARRAGPPRPGGNLPPAAGPRAPRGGNGRAPRLDGGGAGRGGGACRVG